MNGHVPRPGDFGLVAIGGAAGLLVRIGQWLNGSSFSPFQHAFLVLAEGRVIEAEPGGARIVPLSNYAETNVVYSSWNLADFERHEIVVAGRSFKDVPYNWLDYFSLALLRFGIRPSFVRKRAADPRHLICSQLVDLAYQRAGLHMFVDDRDPGDVVPADLAGVLTGPEVTVP